MSIGVKLCLVVCPYRVLGLLALAAARYGGRQAGMVAQTTLLVGGDEVRDELLDPLVPLVILKPVQQLAGRNIQYC